MFNQSKYTKLYYNLITNFKANTKTIGYEKHHIVPKSCGGDNSPKNVAYVPCRVHFILHKLLPKMMTNNRHFHKMQYALWRMMNPQSKYHSRKYVVTSTEYARQKNYIAKSMGKNNPMLRPEIAALFKRKRPEQSLVAVKRNFEYWKDKKLPILAKVCKTCNMEFSTKRSVALFCSKRCARFAYKKSVLVDSVPMSN